MKFVSISSKVISAQDWVILKSRNCDKSKHRLRTNKYGVTWCIICGRLSNSAAEDLKDNEKLIIK